MMYARMPELTPRERHARLAPLDLSTVAASLSQSLERYQLTPERVRVAMLTGRPVYRAIDRGRSVTIFADTGDRFDGLTTVQAMAEARRFAPEHASTLREAERIAEPDQWTLQHRADLPMYRIALGDAGGTDLYVSERTGDVVVKTTARER